MSVLWRCDDSMTTSPPRPPSPPEGPPRGTNFSRRKAMQPLPPSPALTRIFASSMNMKTWGSRIRAGRSHSGPGSEMPSFQCNETKRPVGVHSTLRLRHVCSLRRKSGIHADSMIRSASRSAKPLTGDRNIHDLEMVRCCYAGRCVAACSPGTRTGDRPLQGARRFNWSEAMADSTM